MTALRDDLGDRMKGYEAIETGRAAMPLLPLYARLDGRCFHAFTRGMDRPFDPALSAIMIEVTKVLVEKTHPLIGYTQSDEISLAWMQSTAKSHLPFWRPVFQDRFMPCFASDCAFPATGARGMAGSLLTHPADFRLSSLLTPDP